jgi:hypothetical protein
MQHNAPTSAQQSPQQSPQIPFDAEKSIAEFVKNYKVLTDAILQYPINPNMRVYALLNFDQGMLWIKEALQLLQQLPSQQITRRNAGKKRKKKKR